MIRLAFFACLLTLLAAAGPATARPFHRASWPFWLSKPERHGSRKLPGDYTHHYGTYRNHSRQESSGFLGFLHSNERTTARHKGPLRSHRAGHRRTTGLF
jgi:hypothetical protein